MNDQRMLKVYFENEQTAVPVTYKMKALVRRAVEAVLAEEEVYGNFEVSVTFTDDEKIRALNKKFRGMDKSTDVLSFPLFEEDEEPVVLDMPTEMLGDIVLSLETASRQADLYGHGIDREIAFLTVHSMLHLFGYDHETGEEDEKEMRAIQSSIVAGMGLEVHE